MTATLGKSAHFDDNYEMLTGIEGVGNRAIFDWLEQTGAAATAAADVPTDHREQIGGSLQRKDEGDRAAIPAKRAGTLSRWLPLSR
jgi:hypothetical protein